MLGIILTGTIWGISGQWEWMVPKSIEEKIVGWKRKWYWSQTIIRVISTSPLEDLEQFAWSLKLSLSELQRELGVLVSIEIEWKGPELVADIAECDGGDSSNCVPEIRQQFFSCLSRRFPELSWVGQTECD
ncbi:hypothetical protein DESME_15385 [Desulfitobacterium metallireducens DSM 15288]|uniref:Uncharacterized protein n=1 Tax=Desulfitobacterium metallireducens DSM 15288 TaxID=871968 RepID=W0EGS6_9FIRM|nr:hypothetical protein DESME_15385 [Desulfitobacterium metallireducens DSM 15288]